MASPSQQIRQIGDPVLRSPCDAVTNFDDSLRALISTMFASMAEASGVGLAANQIGVSLRVFVYECPGEDDQNVRGHIVNPVLVETGGDVIIHDEGCLSVAGMSWQTPRFDYCAVAGVDANGEPVSLTGRGVLARCLQHEIDHLNGRLYLDRLDPATRSQALWALNDT